MTGAFIIKGNLDINTHRGKIIRRHKKKMAIYKSRIEVPEEINLANALISDFQPPEM